MSKQAQSNQKEAASDSKMTKQQLLEAQQQLLLQQQLQAQQEQFNQVVLSKCEGIQIAQSIIYDKLLQGVQEYIFDKQIEAKKCEFANYSSIFLAIKAADFAFIEKDPGEQKFQNQMDKKIQHQWSIEDEPKAASFDTSTMEELKLKHTMKLVDTTNDAFNEDFYQSFTGSQNNLKRGPLSIRSNTLKDQFGRKQLLKNITEKQSLQDFNKLQVLLQSEKEKREAQANHQLDEIDLKVIKLRQKVEMDEKHKKDQALKKKTIQEQMRQKNKDLQLLRLPNDNLSAKKLKGSNDEENGIFNQLSQKQTVTFDYQGNLMLVKNPKMQGRTLIVGPQYQIIDKNESASSASPNKYNDRQVLQKKKMTQNTTGGFDSDDEPDEKRSEEKGSTQGGPNNMFTNKAYYGHIIQALYSQPHKMIDLRPGVVLNEGGKQYGGEIGYSRENQIDLQTYKKSREKSSGNVSRLKTGAMNNQSQFEGSFYNGALNISDMMQSNGQLTNHHPSKSQLFNQGNKDFRKQMDSIQGLDKSSTIFIQENGGKQNFNASYNYIYNDTRSQTANLGNHIMQKKNISRLRRGINAITPNKYNKIKLNDEVISQHKKHYQDKLDQNSSNSQLDSSQFHLDSNNLNGFSVGLNAALDTNLNTVVHHERDQSSIIMNQSEIIQGEEQLTQIKEALNDEDRQSLTEFERANSNINNKTINKSTQPQITTRNIIQNILQSAKEEINHNNNSQKSTAHTQSSFLPDQKRILGRLLNNKKNNYQQLDLSMNSKSSIMNNSMLQLPLIVDGHQTSKGQFNSSVAQQSKSLVRVYQNDEERELVMDAMKTFQEKFNQARPLQTSQNNKNQNGFNYYGADPLSTSTNKYQSNSIQNIMNMTGGRIKNTQLRKQNFDNGYSIGENFRRQVQKQSGISTERNGDNSITEKRMHISKIRVKQVMQKAI